MIFYCLKHFPLFFSKVTISNDIFISVKVAVGEEEAKFKVVSKLKLKTFIIEYFYTILKDWFSILFLQPGLMEVEVEVEVEVEEEEGGVATVVVGEGGGEGKGEAREEILLGEETSKQLSTTAESKNLFINEHEYVLTV